MNAWPKTDAQGNPLNHAELCAWRFGGTCDCPAGSAKDSDVALMLHEQCAALVELHDAAEALVAAPFGSLNHRAFYRVREALAPFSRARRALPAVPLSEDETP